MKTDTVAKSFFGVFNNPERHGYSMEPEEICETLKQEWIESAPAIRSGWWGYCISSTGLKHVHFVVESLTAMRFSAVKKAYPKAHLELSKGSKKEIADYIHKRGAFSETGERVICYTSHGNVEGNRNISLRNRNDVYLRIEQLIEEGLTPAQIMAEDLRLRKEEVLIRKAYFAKRYNETPLIRNVNVIWHIGESGSGKTHSYIQLCNQHGADEVYFYSDYSNGGFDNYCGEKYLFIDELKKNSMSYAFLLNILQGYRSQVHCRYVNVYALWEEVHITSVLGPEDIYESMVDHSLRDKDTIKQLLRRINKYVYHYIENGEYKTHIISAEKYVNLQELEKLVNEKLGRED